MSDTRNVKLGVCQIFFDGEDLGYTKGGVQVEVATQTHRVTVDQFGDSEINENITGRTCKVTAPLAETTIENMVRIMPGASIVATGGTKAAGSITFVTTVPAPGDKITVNGSTFTFLAALSAEEADEIAVGSTVANTATLVIAKLSASNLEGVSRAVYTAGSSGVVTVTSVFTGTEGNSFTLAKTGTNITVSGAVLTAGTEPTSQRVEVTNGIGASLLTTARQLRLHPLANAADDLSQDFIIPLANTAGALTFAYKSDEERVFNVEFTAYPHSTTGLLFQVGV